MMLPGTPSESGNRDFVFSEVCRKVGISFHAFRMLVCGFGSTQENIVCVCVCCLHS